MVSFRFLALGGGGTKGFLHIGALQELEARFGNLTKHFSKGVYGCSIGSIIGTGIGFGLNVSQMERISKRCMNLMFVFDGINVAALTMVSVKKGVVSMESFEKHVLSAFDSEGVDLRNKKLSDSRIPLYVIASNMTRGIPTIFKDNVPIITALKASCCLPFLFQPQVIGNCVYLDGGLITNDMHKLIPKEHQAETLSIYLIHSNPHITPANLEKMSPTEYVYKLYKTTCLYDHAQHYDKNILNLYYSGSGFTNKSEEEKDEMIVAGKCLTRIFLAKCAG